MFSGRGFNISSISVGETEDPSISRITIVTTGDDAIVEQINKQLNKLIDVIKVIDLTYENFVERELLLAKVVADPRNRSEIMQIADVFRARIVDMSSKTLTLEATGTHAKIQAIVAMLKPHGIQAMARTGSVALKRELKG
jgi:acetolactate synthase-1/3 small subunit